MQLMKFMPCILGMAMAAESPRMIKIVLTGGPCGGKTTALAQLSDAFTNAGWKVYRVPEAATVLIPGGVDFAHLDREDAMQFQVNIVRTMMTLEQTYMDLAMVEMRKLKRNVAIIHDRGIMDSHSCNYHLLSCLDMQTQDDWENLLQRVGLNAASASTERYDCVIHLRSAAMGAEKFYQLGNNQARTEGIAQARQLDEACTRAWMSHGHYFVVDNSVKDFASNESSLHLFRQARCRGQLGFEAGWFSRSSHWLDQAQVCAGGHS